MEDELQESTEEFIQKMYEKTQQDSLKKSIMEELKRDVLDFIHTEIELWEDSRFRRDGDSYDHRDLINHMIKEIDFLRKELHFKNSIISDLTKKPEIRDESLIITEHQQIKKTSKMPFVEKSPETMEKISTKETSDEFNTTKIHKKVNEESRNYDRTNNNEKKEKKNVTCIIGDSMIKNIKGWNMNKSLENDFVVVKSFSGATTDCMNDYIKPSIKQKPDRFIVHVGTNDLRSQETPSSIAKSIIDSVMSCNEKANVPVAVSGIITRADALKGKAESVNAILRRSCESRNIAFIDNDNITQEDLNGSKIHLNNVGSTKLAKNLTNFIKKQ